MKQLALSLCLPFALALAITTGPALAQTNSAGSVTFTSFRYTVSAGSLNWLGASAYQSLAGQASDAGGLTDYDSRSYSAANYTPSSLSAGTGAALASALSYSGQRVGVTATASPSTGAAFSLPNYSFAQALTSGDFTLSQAATVTFTVGYVISVAGVAGNSIDGYAEALAQFSLASQTNPSAGGTRTDDRFSFNEPGGAAVRSGSFTVALALGAGEVGTYTLLANSSAYAAVTAVPEPASWLLATAGLAFIGSRLRGRARRRWC